MDLVALVNSPLPAVLVLGGIILVLFAIVGRVGGNVRITLSTRRQWALFLIGAVLIVVGIVAYTYHGAPGEEPSARASAQATPPGVPPLPEVAPAATGLVITPSNESAVRQYETATGSLGKLPSGVHAFVCVRAASTEGPVFPQAEIAPSENGSWSAEVTFESSKGRYEVFIITTSDQQAIALLSDPNSGVAGLPALPDGAAIISPINTVTRD
jgi:hypothetical protein